MAEIKYDLAKLIRTQRNLLIENCNKVAEGSTAFDVSNITASSGTITPCPRPTLIGECILDGEFPRIQDNRLIYNSFGDKNIKISLNSISMVKVPEGYLDYDFAIKGIHIIIKGKGILFYGRWKIINGWRAESNKERDDLISHLTKWSELIGGDKVNLDLGDLRFPYPDSLVQSGYYADSDSERDAGLRAIRNKDL